MGPDAAARKELYLYSSPVLIFELCLFLATYFTVNPRLFNLRLWLIPVAFEAVWYLCANYAFSNPWFNTFNFGLCAVGFTMTMKLVELASLSEPPKYDGQPGCTRSSIVCGTCALNSISYLADIRCLHWNNDSPCHIPEDTRPDGSHFQFYSHTLLRFLKHLFYLDTLHALFSNVGAIGTPQGDTIFRDTFAVTRNVQIRLPHPLLGALFLSFGVGLTIMNAMSTGHYLITLLAAPLTWLPPSISPHSLPASSLKQEWPPLFDDPLKATSLRDFWSNRWHSVFRRNFWQAGGKPGVAIGKYLGGAVAEVAKGASDTPGEAKPEWEDRTRSLGARMGGVMGVFLMSGLLHDVGMWGMGQGTDLGRVTGYFLIQGVGLIVESGLGLGRVEKRGHVANGNGARSNEKASVRSEHHWLMKLWTLGWVVLPVPMMMEAWFQRGLVGVVIVPHALSPARALLGWWNEFAFGQ